MSDAKSFDAFRQYRWGELWQAVCADAGADQPNTLSKAFRACLLVAWWQEPEIARTQLAQLRPGTDCEQLFLRTLTQICLADAQAIPQAIAQLKRLRAPEWMTDWLALEFTGRSRRFGEQAKILKVILKRNPAQRDWPFTACLQSLEHPDADLDALRRVLDQQKDLPPLGKVLAVRAGLKSAEDVAAELSNTFPNSGAHYAALYRFANTQASTGHVCEAIITLDKLAQAGQIDMPLIALWLSLCVSHPAAWDDVLNRIHHAAQLVPNSLRLLGVIASYQLICYWINGRFAEAYAVVKQFHGFTKLADTELDRMNRIFFNYILQLAVAWQTNPSFYAAQDACAVLNVVGESHCLSPAHMIFNWQGERVKAISRFVMGVKMHHLAQPSPNRFKACVIAHLETLQANSHLLLTIGEIDCRPDEGLWPAAAKSGKPLMEMVQNTVDGYLAWLGEHLARHRFSSITLQGIPAPGYSLVGKNDPGDKEGFLNMVREVNVQLKIGALAYGWNFLDVYSTTVNDEGAGNGTWHLDGWHLKPGFYTSAG